MLPPTRHEMLAALQYPLLFAPFSLVMLRYRIFGSHVLSTKLRDGVDFGPEAWRLSGYVTALIIFVAYPVVLSRYDDWLWATHALLTITFLMFWLSSAAWLLVRHFQLQNLKDEKLFQDLTAISHGHLETPAVEAPGWLRAWGVGNAITFAFLTVAAILLLRTLQ